MFTLPFDVPCHSRRDADLGIVRSLRILARATSSTSTDRATMIRWGKKRSNRRRSRQRDSGPDPANVSGTVSRESAPLPKTVFKREGLQSKEVSNGRYKQGAKRTDCAHEARNLGVTVEPLSQE